MQTAWLIYHTRRRKGSLRNAQGNGIIKSNALPNLIHKTPIQSNAVAHPLKNLQGSGAKKSGASPLETSVPASRDKTSYARDEAPRRDKYLYLETVTFKVIFGLCFVMITVDDTSPPCTYCSPQGWKHSFQSSKEWNCYRDGHHFRIHASLSLE